VFGEDFIKQFSYNFDYDNIEFVIQKGRMYVEDKMKAKTKRYARIMSSETIEIPADCVMIISSSFKDKPIKSDGIIVPVNNDLLIARSVINSEQNTFGVRILRPIK